MSQGVTNSHIWASNEFGTYDLTPPPPSKSLRFKGFFSLDFRIPLPPLFGNVLKNLTFF